MDNEQKSTTEEFKVSGQQLVDKVKEIIHEGNIRRIVIKNKEGSTIMEMPVTLGAIGAVFAPILAAVGALAALASDYTIVVEKNE
ncbi:MAG TPA: DUF4342 domain-containing protein [Bellilinea sp.]|nr:DUF4342 domain-containing protein [Bellilinea sp.]